MLMSRFLSAVFIGFMVSCAVQERPITNSAIDFTMEKFERTSSGCNADSSLCARYEVNYPVFIGLDTLVSNQLKRKVESTVSMGNPEAHDWTLEKIASEFIRGFEEFNSEDVDGMAMNWYYKANVKVDVLTDSLISLSVRDEYFTGGAHGGTGKYFINHNPETNTDFTLDSFLKDGYEEALRLAGEKAFRQVHQLPEGVSLLDHGFEFPEDIFALNENYGFSNEGIVFVFNSYEVAAYAVGPTEIIIPYALIHEWIR
jgi:hypothetical protein